MRAHSPSGRGSRMSEALSRRRLRVRAPAKINLTLRILGQPGHQIIADGKDAAGGASLTLVQWLRFGSGAYMQMIGIARADGWKEAYPRFRSVRDGVDTR